MMTVTVQDNRPWLAIDGSPASPCSHWGDRQFSSAAILYVKSVNGPAALRMQCYDPALSQCLVLLIFASGIADRVIVQKAFWNDHRAEVRASVLQASLDTPWSAMMSQKSALHDQVQRCEFWQVSVNLYWPTQQRAASHSNSQSTRRERGRQPIREQTAWAVPVEIRSGRRALFAVARSCKSLGPRTVMSTNRTISHPAVLHDPLPPPPSLCVQQGWGGKGGRGVADRQATRRWWLQTGAATEWLLVRGSSTQMLRTLLQGVSWPRKAKWTWLDT